MTNTVDPNGTDEALKQLVDIQPLPKQKSSSPFSYYLANLLLILSTVTYERDDNLVRSASKILRDIDNQEERAQAAALLEASEQTIDSKAQLLGMHFVGISELKSLGGPYAGLFYNDDAIVLAYKGTSVLAFNEYLIDATIERVNAREYLYGEVHKGFYESLFPDVTPVDCFDRATYDKTNPFNTIMESVFEVARMLKQRSGKPINFWITGHSLGGALSALTMARLQLPLRAEDPLFKGQESATIKTHNSDGTPRTVLQEMLARFNASSLPSSSSASGTSSPTLSASSTYATFLNFFRQGHRDHDSHSQQLFFHHGNNGDEDLILLRDCYTYASPKLGDTAFAQEFDRHHTAYLRQSAYKPVYYRVTVDKDIIPRMPLGCSTDPDDRHRELMFPCIQCAKKPETSLSDGEGERVKTQESEETPLNASLQKPGEHDSKISYGATDHHHRHYKGKDFTVGTTAASTTPLTTTATSISASAQRQQQQSPQHMNSLLDYRNVGQMICLPNKPLPPIVKPSEHQTNLSGEVLRSDESMKLLLEQIELAVAYRNNDSTHSSNIDNADGVVPVRDNNNDHTANNQTTPFKAQKIAEQVERAKLKRDLNESARLRVPCDAEKFLLTFPNLISHSPATYQRNLVRTRYFFQSFPGTEMETLIQQVAPLTVKEQQRVREQDEGEGVTRIVHDEDLGAMVERQRGRHTRKAVEAMTGKKVDRPTAGMFANRDSAVVIDMEE
ncbi:hypothetical protein BGZ99_009860 [Dissophora globulifera]|uniref:Fungal lipase-type domain-containing protein n=1 Tax=Dissophora globulifera TaxID=979702 RepID=A0A9P6RS58_9FUNG|nr:hypothetical protein BGZ99_009860 [Dissophora globulifera]